MSLKFIFESFDTLHMDVRDGGGGGYRLPNAQPDMDIEAHTETVRY